MFESLIVCTVTHLIPHGAVMFEMCLFWRMDFNHAELKPAIHWGVVEGKEVFLYTIRFAEGLVLRVTNYGASVQSLAVAGPEGFTDVVLGYDSLEGYQQDPYYIGAVVGRSANRIDGGRVTIDGTLYPLPVTAGGFHHHGGTSGFNKKVWELVSLTASAVTLRYVSAHLEEGYPGELDLQITYRVEGLAWHVEFHATTDRPTIVNLTQHAYFNLKGKDDVLDHVVQLAAKEILAVDERIIPTGSFLPVAHTPFDFTGPMPIGARIGEAHPYLLSASGYDHFYVLERVHSGLLKKVGDVYVPGGIGMEVSTTEPGVHFYTGNFIAGHTPGKSGALYGPRGGFCLETHHFPDTPNHAHFPSTVLRPGEIFSSKTVFRFRQA
jgi:aldose 1-epimerase